MQSPGSPCAHSCNAIGLGPVCTDAQTVSNDWASAKEASAVAALPDAASLVDVSLYKLSVFFVFSSLQASQLAKQITCCNQSFLLPIIWGRWGAATATLTTTTCRSFALKRCQHRRLLMCSGPYAVMLIY